jgi:hypothetical protein
VNKFVACISQSFNILQRRKVCRTACRVKIDIKSLNMMLGRRVSQSRSSDASCSGCQEARSAWSLLRAQSNPSWDPWESNMSLVYNQSMKCFHLMATQQKLSKC